MTDFTAIQYQTADGVAWITLDRPHALNAIDAAMRSELRTAWTMVRRDPDVRVAVITGAGERAFSSGADRSDMEMGSAEDGPMSVPPGKVPGSPGYESDLELSVCPKTVGCWKPVIAAVNGIACGGAFYILGESDIIIASDNATFFDPHVTFGMVSGYESIHIRQRLPVGEVLRMQLMGNYERMSAARALSVGLVSEVVAAADLHEAAAFVARSIAAQSPDAIEGTMRAIWASIDLPRPAALAMSPHFIAMANPADWASGQQQFKSGEKIQWRLR